MIRILVADAQYLIVEGLRALLHIDERMEIVGEVQEASQLTEMIRASIPDILILDHSTLKGFEIKMLQSLVKQVQVLIITSDHNPDILRNVLSHGVTGFLFKDCAKSEIIDAIFSVSKKQRCYCKQVLDIVLDKTSNRDEIDCLPTSLTERETEIVKLVARGFTTAEIATQLSLSKHTVYTHRKNILRKLGLSSATEVVRYAISTGLVEAST